MDFWCSRMSFLFILMVIECSAFLVNPSYRNPSDARNSISSPTLEVYHTKQSTDTLTTAESDLKQCRSADDRQGVCYTASVCSSRGGVPMGRCGSSLDSVCCVFEATCGDLVSEQFAYFRNPSYPKVNSQPSFCGLRIQKHQSNICQLKLEFQQLQLAPPNYGNCSQDLFFVTGQNGNNRVPRICGQNDGQHYYLQIDESAVISLHVQMQNTFDRKFNILVQQIACESVDLAPANCLQYERSVQGEIRSFNYPIEFDSFASSPATFERSQSGRRWHRSNRQKTTVESGSDRRLAESGYPNSLDYVICFERKSGFCSIGYSFDPTQTPFEVGAADRGHKLPAGIGRQAMTDSTTYRLMSVCEDDTDFVAIGTHRLCSRSLALDASSLMVELNLTSRPTTVWPAADQTSNISASSDGNLTQLPLHLEAQLLTNLNADSTYRQGRSDREAWSRVDFGNDAHTINNTQLTLLDDSPGPFLLRFVSNHARNGQGFHFNFKQIPCN